MKVRDLLCLLKEDGWRFKRQISSRISMGYRSGMHEAFEHHLSSMREDGDAVPEPSHAVDMLEVA